MMQMTQHQKGEIFRALHERPGVFIIPNPWDIGSARMLAHLGFEALATTSAGYAFSIGRVDYGVGREAMIGHVGVLASATELPLSADLENGFSDAPKGVAETIRLAAAAGAVGGSIEDSTGNPERPIYETGLAAERVRAAAESARGLGFPFTLTARAENYLHGRRDLKDTITRLQAYQEAGADVLYAPGLTSKEEIATLVSSVDRPVNVLMGIAGIAMTMTDLEAIGVKRVSVGGALARAAYGGFLRGAREMRTNGTFGFVANAADSREIVDMFQD